MNLDICNEIIAVALYIYVHQAAAVTVCNGDRIVCQDMFAKMAVKIEVVGCVVGHPCVSTVTFMWSCCRGETSE